MLSNAYLEGLVKYGSYSISSSGVMKNHLHIWHTCIWTHIFTSLQSYKIISYILMEEEICKV